MASLSYKQRLESIPLDITDPVEKLRFLLKTIRHQLIYQTDIFLQNPQVNYRTDDNFLFFKKLNQKDPSYKSCTFTIEPCADIFLGIYNTGTRSCTLKLIIGACEILQMICPPSKVTLAVPEGYVMHAFIPYHSIMVSTEDEDCKCYSIHARLPSIHPYPYEKGVSIPLHTTMGNYLNVRGGQCGCSYGSFEKLPTLDYHDHKAILLRPSQIINLRRTYTWSEIPLSGLKTTLPIRYDIPKEHPDTIEFYCQPSLAQNQGYSLNYSKLRPYDHWKGNERQEITRKCIDRWDERTETLAVAIHRICDRRISLEDAELHVRRIKRKKFAGMWIHKTYKLRNVAIHHIMAAKAILVASQRWKLPRIVWERIMEYLDWSDILRLSIALC